MAGRTPTENRPGDTLGSGQIANAPANEPGPGSPDERERRQRANGLKFLAVGIVLIAVGVGLVPVLGDGNQNGIGATIAFFGALPAAAGVALIAASIVSRRSGKDKPFA